MFFTIPCVAFYTKLLSRLFDEMDQFPDQSLLHDLKIPTCGVHEMAENVTVAYFHVRPFTLKL